MALKEEFGGKVEFVIADVDSEEGKALASEYGVNLIPAFFLLDRQGKVADTVVGEASQSELKRKLEQLAR